METPPEPQADGDGALLEAVGLKKYFPVTKGLLISKTTGHIKAVDGVTFELRPGETLGDRGGVRLRQEHHGQDDADAGGTHRGVHPVRGQGDAGRRSRYAPGVPPLGAGRVPGPVEFPEPANAGARPHCRAHGHQLEHEPRRYPEPGDQAPHGRGSELLPRQPLPSRVLRRPAAASRHCPRPGPQPQGHRAGRARIGAGRVHPGADYEPAERPADRNTT